MKHAHLFYLKTKICQFLCNMFDQLKCDLIICIFFLGLQKFITQLANRQKEIYIIPQRKQLKSSFLTNQRNSLLSQSFYQITKSKIESYSYQKVMFPWFTRTKIYELLSLPELFSDCLVTPSDPINSTEQIGKKINTY